MRTHQWTTLAGAMMSAFVLAAASEAGIERDVVGGKETIECGGQSVEINGASSDLTLLGDCPHVEVNGSSNTVRIEQARHIEISGMGNTVIWERGANGKRPSIDNSGLSNTARQGRVTGASEAEAKGSGAAATRETSSRPAAALRSERTSAIAIVENGRTQTIACAGKNVTVDGNFNNLSLTGECKHLEVNGNGNVVHVEIAAAISAAGNKNKITWDRGADGQAPKLSNLGIQNEIVRTTE